jgi:uncharacterized damage-inducible protein DinB
MSLSQQAVSELQLAHERFHRSTGNLPESLSGFTPATGMMTTSQQVAHCARVIDWFLEGAFRPEGFDMNFEPQIAQVLAVPTLADAREWLDRSITDAIHVLGAKSDADLMAPLADGPVMGGMPVFAIVSAIVDHTAHHRGALTAYARANGIVPADPYGG